METKKEGAMYCATTRIGSMGGQEFGGVVAGLAGGESELEL